MNYKIIAFDLQGTLSNSSFSDEFWFDTLPKLYSESKKIPIEDAKVQLKTLFKEYGKYDFRYYSVDYWMKELKLSLKFEDIKKLIITKPHFFRATIDLLEELSKKYTLIIISSTTKEFIKTELGKNKKYFKQVYSSIDDFNTAGKPKEIYLKIAQINNVSPGEILYIGDDPEMDVKNAGEAGYNTFFFNKKEDRSKIIDELKQKIAYKS
jgi:HAD superfamily hydrolase (TIGR01549 family)